MPAMIHPNTFPEKRGVAAAENYIAREAVSRTSGGGKQVTDNEVNAAYARADQYMPNGEKVSAKSSLQIALKLLQKDLTKEGIDAIFKRFEIEPPTDPIIDDNIIRPRYGLMETARPIIERVNAGTSTEEDVARLQLLKALAERGIAGDSAPARPRGRAFAPMGVRSASPSDMVAVHTEISAAITRAIG